MVYVKDGDGSQVCASSLLSVLPASHAVIGCDTVCPFVGHGNVTA